MALDIKPLSSCAYTEVSLGEIMLRLDPGDGRVRTARRFDAWEGGGGNTTLPVDCAGALASKPP